MDRWVAHKRVAHRSVGHRRIPHSVIAGRRVAHKQLDLVPPPSVAVAVAVAAEIALAILISPLLQPPVAIACFAVPRIDRTIVALHSLPQTYVLGPRMPVAVPAYSDRSILDVHTRYNLP